MNDGVVIIIYYAEIRAIKRRQVEMFCACRKIASFIRGVRCYTRINSRATNQEREHRHFFGADLVLVVTLERAGYSYRGRFARRIVAMTSGKLGTFPRNDLPQVCVPTWPDHSHNQNVDFLRK